MIDLVVEEETLDLNIAHEMKNENEHHQIIMDSLSL